mgnify:CR=1 FL=1
MPRLRGWGRGGRARARGSRGRVVDEHQLEKEFRVPDFEQARSFTNAVGAIAEREGHHHDIHLAWGKVRIEIWTHKIGGLHENDFILASKIDGLLEEPRRQTTGLAG